MGRHMELSDLHQCAKIFPASIQVESEHPEMVSNQNYTYSKAGPLALEVGRLAPWTWMQAGRRHRLQLRRRHRLQLRRRHRLQLRRRLQLTILTYIYRILIHYRSVICYNSSTGHHRLARRYTIIHLIHEVLQKGQVHNYYTLILAKGHDSQPTHLYDHVYERRRDVRSM